MGRRKRDPGGSELSLPDVLDASDVRVPVGYRRMAGLTVVEHVGKDEAPEVLAMLGIGVAPTVREEGEPIV
jgi:hypothetical protein